MPGSADENELRSRLRASCAPYRVKLFGKGAATFIGVPLGLPDRNPDNFTRVSSDG